MLLCDDWVLKRLCFFWLSYTFIEITCRFNKTVRQTRIFERFLKRLLCFVFTFRQIIEQGLSGGDGEGAENLAASLIPVSWRWLLRNGRLQPSDQAIMKGRKNSVQAAVILGKGGL